MDPNNPDQKPGDPAPPPVWGPPPAPDQPGYVAPPSPWGPPPAPAAPEQPGWAAPPPAYGAPPPAYGAPQDPNMAQTPYGAPQDPNMAQTPYGAPPDPNMAQTPYGAPPDPNMAQAPYGAPQAPYGAPQAPYGAPPPAWGAPGPTTPAKGGMGKRIFGGLSVVILLIVIGVAYVLIANPSHGGQVIFTTDAPTESGAATCQLGHQVSSVTTGSSVYANFFYKSRLTNATVTLTIIKDGTVLTTSTLTSDQANGIDCVESSANLNTLDAGVYEFKLTTANGDVVSDGTLTVK